MNLRKKINKIKGDRMRAVGLAEYKINWLKFSSKHDSWVSEKDLKCDEIIQSYLWGKAVRGTLTKENSKRFNKNFSFTVEKIRASRQNLNRIEYEVKWANCKKTTWEKEANLKNAKTAIKEFEREKEQNEQTAWLNELRVLMANLPIDIFSLDPLYELHLANETSRNLQLDPASEENDDTVESSIDLLVNISNSLFF